MPGRFSNAFWDECVLAVERETRRDARPSAVGIDFSSFGDGGRRRSDRKYETGRASRVVMYMRSPFLLK